MHMTRLSSTSSNSNRSKKGRLKKWELISVPSIDDLKDIPESELSNKLLEPGFCIRFFQQDMLFLYTVASHKVLITRGVLDYLHDYNQLGPNKSRNKIFLCSSFSKNKTCLNGSLCREVHCLLPICDAKDANLFGVTSNATGAPNVIEITEEKLLLNQIEHNLESNDDISSSFESSASSGGFDHSSVIRMPDTYILRHSLHSRWTTKSMYPTLPAGVLFQVALPNTPTPVDEYDSGELFATKGAQEYYDHIIKNKLSSLSMQHCAHFTKNGICCFGEDCAFVHVVHQRQREKLDGSSSDAENFSGAESSASSDISRRLKKKGNISKDTPLSMEESRFALPEYSVNSTVHIPSNSMPLNGSGTMDNRWILQPPIQTTNNGLVMTSVPTSVHPVQVHQNVVHPSTAPNSFMMMQGIPQCPPNPYPQQQLPSTTAPQQVYVFQPVYMQPNMLQ